MRVPEVLGFVGLGNMGRPMAANIAGAGFEMLCFDAAGTVERTPGPGVPAESVDDLWRGADTVFLSLPDGRVVLEVLAGLVAAGDERRTSVVCDLSTIGPETARAAADKLGEVGVTYVDGPVSGGQAGAVAGTISLMYSGPARVLDCHRGIFEAFSGTVFHCGNVAGQGQAMKLLNNFLSATALAATSEAAAYGVANGLDLAQIIDVLNASSGRNSASDDKFPNRVLTGTYDSGFHTRLMTKDVELLRASATDNSTPTSVIDAVLAVWQAANEAMPDSDFTEIWKYVSEAP